jgi:CHAT domain-containing protein
MRILGLIAAPSNLAELDVEKEKVRVEKALARLIKAEMVELVWLAEPTWRGLQRAMRRGPWHIFHFIGHGAFDTAADEGQVYLETDEDEDDEHKSAPLTATQLGLLLADHDSLRLVVLNACESGLSGKQDIFSSTASILVQRGLPAVLAMQYETRVLCFGSSVQV